MQSKLVIIEELAERLRVSTSLVRTWLREGKIPENTYIKIGHTYRFDEDAVVSALINYKEESKPEPEVVVPQQSVLAMPTTTPYEDIIEDIVEDV